MPFSCEFEHQALQAQEVSVCTRADNACFGARGLALSRDMDTNASELSARDQAILKFEEGWWLLAGSRAKSQAIRDDLGISPATFYTALEGLLDSSCAAAAHPLLIARLRRRRTERRRAQMVGNEPIRRSP